MEKNVLLDSVKEMSVKAKRYDDVKGRNIGYAAKLKEIISLLNALAQEIDPAVYIGQTTYKKTSRGEMLAIVNDMVSKMHSGALFNVNTVATLFNVPDAKARYLMHKALARSYITSRKDGKRLIIYSNRSP